MVFVCTAHGRRASVLDLWDFLVCVHDEHCFALRAKFGNNGLGVRGVERWTD